jgi:hypothetical protein
MTDQEAVALYYVLDGDAVEDIRGEPTYVKVSPMTLVVKDIKIEGGQVRVVLGLPS